jgi:hypothetical protein
MPSPPPPPFVVTEGHTVNAVTDLMIDNTGTNDVTQEITDALTAYSKVYLPAGTY